MATADAERQEPRGASYTLPDSYARLSEISSPGPEENPHEAALYRHRTLEEVREMGRVERVPDVSQGGEDEQEEEVGCLCKVVVGWVKRAIHRKRGE